MKEGRERFLTSQGPSGEQNQPGFFFFFCVCLCVFPAPDSFTMMHMGLKKWKPVSLFVLWALKMGKKLLATGSESVLHVYSGLKYRPHVIQCNTQDKTVHTAGQNYTSGTGDRLQHQYCDIMTS